MFSLKQLANIGRSARQPDLKNAHSSPPAREPIRLVAITQNLEDAATLRKIANSQGWQIEIVGSSAAALASLKNEPAPLVICDSELSGESWHDVLAKITGHPQAVCVLLASRVADDYLWRQVIRNQGYDIVVKPFQAEELRRSVTFAWSWRGWAYRHYAGLRKHTD